MSAPVLVCFALEGEAKPFRRLMRGRDDVRILVTGMARRNTEREIHSALEAATPGIVFTCGVAGALDALLRIGDVLFETAEEQIAEKLRAAGGRAAKFACADRVAITRAEKTALRERTQADAVEMESAFIHEACAKRRIACATVRAISDTADDDLPLDFNLLWTEEQKLSPVKLALAILRAPHRISALIRLGQNSARAAEELARVLTQVI